MANRKVGNTWIIDTNGALATQPATLRSLSKIAAIGFYSIDTTAVVKISLSSDTTNIVVPLATNINVANFNVFQYGGWYVDELTAVTVTAGTAYLYLI